MAYAYFRQWLSAEYGIDGNVDDNYRDFRKVCEAAIDAAREGQVGIARELAEQAHSLLSQTEQNLNPDGWRRRLEIRMNREIEEAAR